MNLIDDWKKAHRYWSVRLNSAGIALMGISGIVNEAWNSMPPDLRQAVPYAQGIATALFVLGLFARVVKQKGPGNAG